jgi:hypothetical protein
MLNIRPGQAAAAHFAAGRVILAMMAMMSIEHSVAKDAQKAGLCADCVHSRRIESSRGAVFYLCELSRTNPSFVKYPRLPVLSCAGYAQAKCPG